MKFIIELEDQPIQVKNSRTGKTYDIYLAKNFNTVFFDAEGLRRLEPYERQSAYQKGYEAGFAEGRRQAETKDDEIRVGDEVKLKNESAYGIVITNVPKGARVLFKIDTIPYISFWMADECEKTGRHFPEVEKLLEAMKE